MSNACVAALNMRWLIIALKEAGRGERVKHCTVTQDAIKECVALLERYEDREKKKATQAILASPLWKGCE